LLSAIGIGIKQVASRKSRNSVTKCGSVLGSLVVQDLLYSVAVEDSDIYLI